ncbi:hypothetical protein T11_17123 [Trichinella zimbabwensis]|uniref:Uncharacterized protein n=1 Tax=Trichinella zimbabwensis TaxID=268475 RepID=A0A0V1GM90_9BILA|nr:hypothetical protein T11_17123 [Trichinella zimbabwensis]
MKIVQSSQQQLGYMLDYGPGLYGLLLFLISISLIAYCI